MKRLYLVSFILVLSCGFSNCVFAEHLGTLSYGAAAGRFTPSRLLALADALPALSQQSLPHEAKELRKIIVQARDMADLFSFAYPSGSDDLLLHLREDLDIGYEIIGSFKDLFDYQGVSEVRDARYNRTEVQERLRPVLEWANLYSADSATYLAYARSPLRQGYAIRNRRNLSNQFWGISRVVPRAEEQALDAFKRLIADQMAAATSEYEEVLDIGNPAKDERRIETYHDFRKRMRSFAKITKYFTDVAALFRPQDLQTVDELVSRYGSISDMIIKLEILHESGKKRKADALIDEIKNSWQETQLWEQTVQWSAVLSRLQRN